MSKTIQWTKIFEHPEALDNFDFHGKVHTMLVGKKKVCIVKTSEGFAAFQEKCPHNGASLSHGWCTEQNSVVCPMHRYHFDLKTGKALSGIGDRLEIYRVKLKSWGEAFKILYLQ